MLTLVESISLAGDRAKQNDDAHGALGACAWVIDGATDLHDAPTTEYASDAAWLAHYLNSKLCDGLYDYDISGADADDLRHELARTAESAAKEYMEIYKPLSEERWRLPSASLLIVSELEQRELIGLDLGDCRCFALDAAGAAHAAGGPRRARDTEAQMAADAAKQAGGRALLRDPNTLARLREQRAAHNLPDTYWVFGLQSECAAHARSWSLDLIRPAHLVLCTDGFSALVDRYRAYDPAGLVRAALDKGLHALGQELRAIETDDRESRRHPRFKPSDDATALLLRLT